ncbi:hypothetical protein BD779DRAFT_1447524, partial [Infundibulicybe gibba]
GTSVALAFPLILLARRRNAVLRSSLHGSSAPPRRTGARTSMPPVQKTSAAAEAKAQDDARSPGMGELLGAISQVDFSTAIYAGKAFGIATLLVAGVGTAGVFGVKALMGVQDTREFAHKMRMAVWTRFPGLTARIHRPVEEDDVLDGVEGVVVESGAEEGWSWGAAEERLQKAYETGGAALWARVALREMEVENRVEQAKRRGEGEGA